MDAPDPEQVACDLLRLADGRIRVLVRWERADGPQWCHRSLTPRG
jgi:hypothetical protein